MSLAEADTEPGMRDTSISPAEELWTTRSRCRSEAEPVELVPSLHAVLARPPPLSSGVEKLMVRVGAGVMSMASGGRPPKREVSSPGVPPKEGSTIEDPAGWEGGGRKGCPNYNWDKGFCVWIQHPKLGRCEATNGEVTCEKD